jgi:phosphatidylglycerol:prolipoprotein diacylglycerol transferase
MIRFFPDFDTFLSIGSYSIQMYAVMILTGATIAYFIAKKRFEQRGYDSSILSDYFFNMLFIGILGARIWYVIFKFSDLYIHDPLQIFAIWNGGLAIQGGIVAGLIYSYYFFKKNDICFLRAGDAIMPCVLIAQACGRWGNFFNHEAFGGDVTLEFLQSLMLPNFIIENMYINGAYHHPTFLYEAVGNLAVFIIIVFVVGRFQKYKGTQFYSYFIGYGIVRYFVEGLRTDSLMLGPIRMAQLTSIVFIVAGLVGIFYSYKKGWKEVSE